MPQLSRHSRICPDGAQMVGEDGKALTSADSVVVDIEDVAALRDAVFAKISRATTMIAADLTVFANGVALDPRDSGSYDEKVTLMVQAPRRAESDSRYFIQPNVHEQVEKALFVIVEDDEEHKGVGLGVFFSPTLAVTCDHNLTEQHTVGSVVPLALKDQIAHVKVVARNSELDFAILKSSSPRAFIPPWSGRPDELRGRFDLVLASYPLGIDEYKNQLGFAPVAGISISAHRRHIIYSCPMFAGDSGAAILIKDGFLIGIHQETINALREEMERKKVIKECLNDVEESLDNIVKGGLAQGCLGLLVHEFKKVVSDS